MANLPKISVITPSLNAGAVIVNCILSVANQNYIAKEHIIVDGLSTDDTLDNVKKYASRYPHIRCISEKDAGIYEAMNKGIDMAQGEWLYFLGSGDVFHSNNVLKIVAEKINADPTDIVYGDVAMSESGKIYDGEFTKAKLIEKNICQQAIFFRKAIFEKIGKFETRYITLADWVFNMKWLNNADMRSKYIPFVVAKYASGGRSKTVFDKNFYGDFEDNIKKYFPAEYQEIHKKTKGREIKFIKNEKTWKLWEWNNKIKFAVFHPQDFFKKYFKK